MTSGLGRTGGLSRTRGGSRATFGDVMSQEPEQPVAGPHGVRATNDVCRQLDDTRYLVDGRELSLPMDIHECTLVLNAFAVDADQAQALLEGTGLSAARVMPGRAVLLLLGVDYRDNPLGNYREAAVLLSAYAPDQHVRTWLGGALSMLMFRVPYFVYRMPVDQELTTHAGRFLWGYPKYLASIEVEREAGAACARLQQDREPVFTIRAPAARGAGRRMRERTGYNLTLRGDRLRRIPGTVAGDGLVVRAGGTPPELGDNHPLALELRRLGLPKRPLMSASLAHARMRFGVPEAWSLKDASGK